jgi:hypothetical protein
LNRRVEEGGELPAATRRDYDPVNEPFFLGPAGHPYAFCFALRLSFAVRARPFEL